MAEWRAKHARTALLDIAYGSFGPEDGTPVILLHGFPYDVRSYAVVTEILVARGLRCVVPFLRGYGPTRFLDATTPRSGQQGALGSDLLNFMDALALPDAVLGGYDWGGRAACIVAALWPQRVRGLVSCGVGYNVQDLASARRPAAPEKELRHWYHFYFATARGREALMTNRRDVCQFLWRLWSPRWSFDDATFADTAAAFDNDDFVEVVLHSYRHRLGEVAGDPVYDALEARLAAQPSISVPTVVLLGAEDGVTPPPAEDADARHFEGRYTRQIVRGVGHNMPQEAPDVFADAVLSLV